MIYISICFKTNVLVCETFIMKKQPWKKVLFFASGYWHIHRFPCFTKKEDQNVQHWQLQVFHFQKRWRERIRKNWLSRSPNSEVQKKQDSFRVCSFYIHSKSDVNTISDLIRVEKYVDNNIQIFYLLWGLIWKILIGKYCEDLAWAEYYDKKKGSKWFCLVCQKIIAITTDSVVCSRYLKWNHSSCAFLKKLPKFDIAKLNLKIGIGNRAKWSI